MNEFLKNIKINEWINYLKIHYTSYLGLFSSTLLVCLLYGVFVWAAFFVLNLFNAPQGNIEQERFLRSFRSILNNTFLVVFPLIVFTNTIVWIKKRRLPRLNKTEKAIIAFSQNCEDKLIPELQELYNKLKEEIESRGLGSLVKIVKIPIHEQVSDSEKASKILKKGKYSIVVWGRFDEGMRKGKRELGFDRVWFTGYHVKENLPDEKLRFDPKNNIVERLQVADNITNAASLLIGRSLYQQGQNEKCTQILQSTLDNLKSNSKSKPAFRKLLLKNLSASIASKALHEYLGQKQKDGFFGLGQDFLNKLHHQLWISYEYNNKNWIALNLLSIVKFLLGDYSSAKKFNEKASSISNELNPKLAKAFLFLFEGKFDNAKRIYKDIVKLKNINLELIKEAVSFTEQTLIKFPDKKQLLFAIGILKIHYFDKSEGIENLKELKNSLESNNKNQNTLRYIENLIKGYENKLAD